MTDREAVDFLKKAKLHLCVPRGSAKQVTMTLYIEAMAKAINALEEKTKALPIPMSRPHEKWEYLKDCITDMRNADGKLNQKETCQFILNLMGVMERGESDGEDKLS